MADVSWLNTEESRAFFHDSHHVPVTLKRLANARVVWLNQKAAAGDPHFDRLGRDMARYEKHILSCCAYTMAAQAGARETCDDDEVIGYADRYGGSGIGLNGGSGRAAVVNGYLVKGIGRTPLVSALTEFAHASGGAYLEECVRETIYSEIVCAEFPHSAIPVLAIIDTGLQQIFEGSTGTIVERRTLLVRPCFVRPAHFERATGYYSGNPKEGALDTARVSRFFAQAMTVWGRERLIDHYKSLWSNWAQQLAYSFVHRLPHGSNTVSNICLDGKLLDFGAMSAVPSWADAAIMESRQNFGAQFNLIPAMIRSSGYFFNRYLEAPIVDEKNIAAWTTAVQHAYLRVTVIETLRLCGVSHEIAENAANGPDFALLWRSIYSIINYFQRERINMVETTPDIRIKWDLHLVWDQEPPSHLAGLRAILKRMIPSDEQAIAVKRSSLLTATRKNLFREEMKREIFSTLDRSCTGAHPDRRDIERFVNERVAGGRRDHRFRISDAVPVGFAISASSSYVLFEEGCGDRMFAIKELYAGSSHQSEQAYNPERYPVIKVTPTSIQFQNANVPDFEGAVKMYHN